MSLKLRDLDALSNGVDPDESRRLAYLDKKFGSGTYEKVRKWNNETDCRCMICGGREKTHHHGVRKHLMVDHDHQTGEVRGLLCQRCNLSLGHIKDDVHILQKMLVYIKNKTHKEIYDLGLVNFLERDIKVTHYPQGSYARKPRNFR